MPGDIVRNVRAALFERGGGGLLVTLGACMAALLANIAIDITGDYVLPHDTYDDVAHGSRLLLTGAALGIFISAALFLVLTALDRTRGVGERARELLGTIAPMRLGSFAALICGITFVLLPAMESVDLISAGQMPDGIADLFGGSLVLGTCITVPIAVTVALVLRFVARWASVVHVLVVRLADAWSIARSRTSDSPRVRVPQPRRGFALAPAIDRSVAKRGPPPPSR
jgi:hypothetical protein